MNEVEISVIIPIYNRGYCLERCLDSVLNQYFVAWECWLIDDGSTDDTRTICEKYALKDQRFQVYHQSNRGVSVARNQGLTLAKGRYIAFVDSDDWVENSYLQKLYQAIPGVEWAICGLTEVWVDGRETVLSDEWYTSGLNSTGTPVLSRLIEHRILTGPVNKLYITSIIKREGICFPRDLSLGEDMVFNFTYLSCIQKMRVIPDPLYHVMKQEYSLSARRDETYMESGTVVWGSLRDFFLSDKMRSRESERYVGAYYCTTVANAIGGVQFLHSRMRLWSRFRHIQSILRRMDRSIIETYFGSIPNRWAGWLIRYEKALLLWLFYELKALCVIKK